MKRKTGRQAAMRRGGTALAKYQRLESLGLWRANPEVPLREVLVRMGEATLILADSRSEEVVSHWSLPAVRRLNPGETPALFAPGEEADESVEIEDGDMIAALKTVQGALRQAQPREGRLRGMLIGGALTAILAVSLFVLPGVLKSHTAGMVPAAKRAELGMRALDDVTRLTGNPCDGERGLPALAELAERIFGPEDTPILYILPEGLTRPAHLPGGVILLPKSLIELDSPEALAGAALAEAEASKRHDPMREILDHAGLKASFDLLTSGDLPADALTGYGAELLRQPPQPVPVSQLAARFGAAQLKLEPYAHWLDPSGASTAELIAADPFKGLVSSPLLPDDDWIALQSVCSG